MRYEKFSYMMVGTVPQNPELNVKLNCKNEIGSSSGCFTSLHDAVWAKLSCPTFLEVCAVLGEPLKRSQPNVRGSLLINVYWHCRVFPHCTTFPSDFRRRVFVIAVVGCSKLLLFHCLTVFVFFSQHITVVGRMFSFDTLGLQMLWYIGYVVLMVLLEHYCTQTL